ncbi:type II toxin-antitoxin system RelE/ParE family toxin [Flavobacterium sp. RHBU_24]|uniref:type II toxin-antitoxin system RelE/ParE family toxin n=1 Tax=Flavobacterium sp. RHBU_24 TaxID=3391185 RepID=UPI003984C436
MKLILTERARKDIRGASEWYNEKQKGLGKRFAQAIFKEMDFISKNPDAYSARYKTIHTAVVSIFPYMIHYDIEPDRNQITILAVIHTSLNPQKWK